MKNQIESFELRFAELHGRSVELVRLVPDDKLFWQPPHQNKIYAGLSFGVTILRSAGKVEQTFGGLTARLWDDPFEWTLPEELADSNKILKYLAEVESIRSKGFAMFQSDNDLDKQIPTPEGLSAIFDILLKTLCQAEHLQGRAFSIFQLFSDEKLPSV